MDLATLQEQSKERQLLKKKGILVVKPKRKNKPRIRKQKPAKVIDWGKVREASIRI